MCFCLDTLHGCSNRLHGCSNTRYGYSNRMSVDFSMFSHLYPERYTSFSSLHFSPIKSYQDIIFKLFNLTTVSKKITIVRAVYLYSSGAIFATKYVVTDPVLKVRSFMRDILASLDRGKYGL